MRESEKSQHFPFLKGAFIGLLLGMGGAHLFNSKARKSLLNQIDQSYKQFFPKSLLDQVEGTYHQLLGKTEKALKTKNVKKTAQKAVKTVKTAANKAVKTAKGSKKTAQKAVRKIKKGLKNL